MWYSSWSVMSLGFLSQFLYCALHLSRIAAIRVIRKIEFCIRILLCWKMCRELILVDTEMSSANNLLRRRSAKRCPFFTLFPITRAANEHPATPAIARGLIKLWASKFARNIYVYAYIRMNINKAHRGV